MIGAVRRDENTTLVDTTNEIAPLQVNATGELKVAQIQALPTGANIIGALVANQSINEAQIAGTAKSVNQGAADAGTTRVAVVNEQIQDLYFTGQAAQTATINNIIPATASANATDATGYRSGSVQLICPAGTYTTGAVIFEGSNDNTNFVTIPVYSQLVLTGTPIVAAITLVTTTNLVYTFPISTRYIRVRISTAVTGASASVRAFTKLSQKSWSPAVYQVAQGTAGNLNATITGVLTTVTPGTAATNLGKARNAATGATDTGVNMLALRNDAPTAFGTTGNYTTPTADIFGNLVTKNQQLHKRTYRTAFVVVPAATATDIFQLIGSASTTVEVTKIIISGTQTTGGLVDVYIAKRSTANSGGTSTSATLVPMISTDAAATAVGSIYTGNPTTGTPVGDIFVASVPLSLTTNSTNNIINIDFGEKGKPVQLVGVAQAIAIRLNGVTITGGSLKITVEFTEF